MLQNDNDHRIDRCLMPSLSLLKVTFDVSRWFLETILTQCQWQAEVRTAYPKNADCHYNNACLPCSAGQRILSIRNSSTFNRHLGAFVLSVVSRDRVRVQSRVTRSEEQILSRCPLPRGSWGWNSDLQALRQGI